jgi:hypothetical protein
VAFFEAKADLFDRIADDPRTLHHEDARRSAWAARDEADRLRVVAAGWGWW